MQSISVESRLTDNPTRKGLMKRNHSCRTFVHLPIENWKAPTSAVTRWGDTIYVSEFPPFDPKTGKVSEAPIKCQTELFLAWYPPSSFQSIRTCLAPSRFSAEISTSPAQDRKHFI